MNVSDAFVDEALAGDTVARRYALEIAAEQLRGGEPLSPKLAAFIAGGLENIIADESKAGARAEACFAKGKHQKIDPEAGRAVAAHVDRLHREGYALNTTETDSLHAKPSAYVVVARHYNLPIKTVETLHRRYRKKP